MTYQDVTAAEFRAGPDAPARSAPPMKINRLAPWFGCDSAVAGRIAQLLAGCAHVTIPFAGSAAVVPLLTNVRSGVLNDLHRHVVNLYRCVKSLEARHLMLSSLDARLFHPDELAHAQRRLMEREARFSGSLFASGEPMSEVPDPEWGADYFVACWMGRGGHAGKGTEFTQSLSTRFTAGGGDSAVRFRSAIDSLDAWAFTLQRWQCTCDDALTLLDSCRDAAECGIYLDPPWPDAGNEYKHRITDQQQRRLRDRLLGFQHARIVVRYGDHPLIRELYEVPPAIVAIAPGMRWSIEPVTSRDQQNGEVRELLIYKGGSA